MQAWLRCTRAAEAALRPKTLWGRFQAHTQVQLCMCICATKNRQTSKQTHKQTNMHTYIHTYTRPSVRYVGKLFQLIYVPKYQPVSPTSCVLNPDTLPSQISSPPEHLPLQGKKRRKRGRHLPVRGLVVRGGHAYTDMAVSENFSRAPGALIFMIGKVYETGSFHLSFALRDPHMHNRP